MIQGYPDYPSVFPGELIHLHVSTDAPQFRIDIYRQGVILDYQTSTVSLEGFFAEDHDHDQDWGIDAVRRDGTQAAAWPPYEFIVPGNFKTGVYIAMFVELDGHGNPNPLQDPPLDNTKADARTSKALFVVKNPVPGVESQLLYKLPYFTYQSYNYQGNGSIYQGVNINLHRPGGGTGGTPWDATLFNAPYGNYDPFDTSSFRQTFQHWDSNFIAWLEYVGFRVDYCTDWDIHMNDGLTLLPTYALMLSVGHDEYYTEKMRNNLEAYISGGGNIAFLSGNTCWWRTEFDKHNPFLMYGQQLIQNWFAIGQPEDSLTGVSYRNAGERDSNGAPKPPSDNEKVGYTVQNIKLWPFENTGLKEGDTFAQNEGIVGYECDGALFNKQSGPPFEPDFPNSPATPPSFIILGIGDTSGFDGGRGNMAATMGMYTQNGTVFTGATADWPRVVWQGESKTVQITKNVINRLGGNPKGLAPLRNVADIICADGFYSDDDGYRHAIVGSANGIITEIFFNPQTGIGAKQIVTQFGLLDLGCFYTPNDQYRHVITALANGNIHEVFFNPQTGLGDALLGNIPKAIAACGFYSADDNFRHAIVATADGDVIEIYYHPTFGEGQMLLGNFENIIDIGCFFTADDNYRHVIVGTADGNIIEIYYHPQHGIFNVVIANVPGIIRLSGYVADNDRFFNRRVQVLTETDSIHEVRYHQNFGIMRTLLFNTSGVKDLGAFYSPDDDFRHSILAFASGEIKELYFNP